MKIKTNENGGYEEYWYFEFTEKDVGKECYVCHKEFQQGEIAYVCSVCKKIWHKSCSFDKLTDELKKPCFHFVDEFDTYCGRVHLYKKEQPKPIKKWVEEDDTRTAISEPERD